jgi:ectoine hydroxylase-related dioxygenase (phytanoyl-CoA dioxygenase family)
MTSRQLSDEQIHLFFTRGYIILDNLFSPQEIDELRAGFDRLQAIAETFTEPTTHRGTVFIVEPFQPARTTPPHVKIHRIQWIGAVEPIFLRYGEDPRILGPVSQLLSMTSMNQLVNQAHFKLPGDGISFPWHQDSQFRRYGTELWDDVNGKGSYVQVATAIDDMTLDNGPLQFIPESASLGHLGLQRLQHQDPTQSQLTASYELDEESKALIHPERAVSVTMKAGSAVLFGPYTIHRSLPNESDKPRRIFINGYACKGANSRIYPGEGAGRLLEYSAK